MQFFNPKVSSIKFGVSVLNKTIQIQIAKSLDPNISQRPQPGQKVYDWDDSLFFSLTPVECLNIYTNLPLLVRGEYRNDAADEKYSKNITITHFLNDKQSLLSLSKNTERNTVVLAIIYNGRSIIYPFRNDELILFREFVAHGYRDVPFYVEFYNGILKYTKKKEWDAKNSSNSSGGDEQSGSFTENETASVQSQFDDINW